MRYTLVVLGLILISCTSCDPIVDKRCERDYVFTIPLELSSAHDTFIVGDTISLSWHFPALVKDEISEEYIDLSEYELNSRISISKISTNPASCSASSFEFIEDTGILNYFSFLEDCFRVRPGYLKMGLDLVFSCKIILKKAGFFAFGVNSYFLDDYIPPVVDSCLTNSIKVNYKLITIGGNANYEFVDLSPDELYRAFTFEEFNNSAGFVFFVND